MLFNSTHFLFIFLPITYAVYWMLSSASARYIWLAVTGYVFYSFWNWRFCFLMLFSTLVSYFAGLGLRRYDSQPAIRKLFLIAPIAVDLSLLGFFKYYNFTATNINTTMMFFGSTFTLPNLDIILPIGISFYTFHTISYIVDSYRREVEPTANFFEFAAYVSLFSQLVAGPIVRFRQIEKDLESIGSAKPTNWLAPGLCFLGIGLAEKVLVADSLAAYVDPALADFTTLSTAGAWLVMSAYSFQLYFDFSGYSSMAVGLGMLFGLRIPMNFNSPYKALNPSDFWRRWHISLSTCMRDYIYIPLGGNRKGQRRAIVNVLVTMLIGGLWHGANWTFVLWGAYHALLLVAYQLSPAWRDSKATAAKQVSMFVLALVGWVLFRSETIHMAGMLLTKLVVPEFGPLPANTALALPVLFIATVWAMRGPNAFEISRQRVSTARLFGLVSAYAASLAIIFGDRVSPFLYFQF